MEFCGQKKPSTGDDINLGLEGSGGVKIQMKLRKINFWKMQIPQNRTQRLKENGQSGVVRLRYVQGKRTQADMQTWSVV